MSLPVAPALLFTVTTTSLLAASAWSEALPDHAEHMELTATALLNVIVTESPLATWPLAFPRTTLETVSGTAFTTSE